MRRFSLLFLTCVLASVSYAGDASRHAEASARKAGRASNQMKSNPFDMGLRTQFQHAMDELNQSMKSLAHDVKRGHLNAEQANRVQERLVTVFENSANENPVPGLRRSNEEATQLAPVTGPHFRRHQAIRNAMAMTITGNLAAGVADVDTTLKVASGESEKSAPAPAPAGSPSSIPPSIPRGEGLTAPPAQDETAAALRKFNSFLVVGATPNEVGAAAQPKRAEEAPADRAIRVFEGAAGEPSEGGEKFALTQVPEGVLSEGETAAFVTEESYPVFEEDAEAPIAVDSAPSRELASFSVMGRKMPFRLKRASGETVTSLSEITLEDLIHSGGKMALLALIVCFSLGLLGFYVTSTLKARRSNVGIELERKD